MFRLFQTLNIGENSLIATYTSVFMYVYNSFDLVIAIYSMLIVIDYLCGVFASLKNNKFNKKIFIWGIIRKLLNFSIILVAMLLDCLLCFLSTKYDLGVYDSGYMTIITSIMLIATEGTSIIEKWKILNLEVPIILKTTFNYLKNIKNMNKK